jgi:hypothetical protein
MWAISSIGAPFLRRTLHGDEWPVSRYAHFSWYPLYKKGSEVKSSVDTAKKRSP